MKVKICGLTTIEGVNAAVKSGADYIGFVFAPSKRQQTIEEAHELGKEIPNNVKKIGVFVNPTLEEVLSAIDQVPLDVVQLHGQELMPFIHQIPCPVIKALPYNGAEFTKLLNQYPKEQVLLIDTPSSVYEGGSGVPFDWQNFPLALLNGRPFFLAGGLTSENVRDCITHFQPLGVDVSSGVETLGEKDEKKINLFIQQAKGVN